MSMKFYKYHGLGNDYLVYDLKENRVELNAEMIAMPTGLVCVYDWRSGFCGRNETFERV